VILEAGVAFVVALVLAVGGLRFGAPVLRGWQHDRCLSRIAALEIELGIRPDPILALHEAKAANFAAALSSGRWARDPEPKAKGDRRQRGLEGFIDEEVALAKLYEERRKRGVKWW
jgi:hypothetical protein